MDHPTAGRQSLAVRLLFALTLCVTVPMTIIRSADSTDAGHNARDQTPDQEAKPTVRLPTIVRPADIQRPGPFRLSEYIVPEAERKDRTAHRQPGGSISDGRNQKPSEEIQTCDTVSCQTASCL